MQTSDISRLLLHICAGAIIGGALGYASRCAGGG